MPRAYEVVLIRHPHHYRLAYGILHLSNMLRRYEMIEVALQGGGVVQVRRDCERIVVEEAGKCIPIRLGSGICQPTCRATSRRLF